MKNIKLISLILLITGFILAIGYYIISSIENNKASLASYDSTNNKYVISNMIAERYIDSIDKLNDYPRGVALNEYINDHSIYYKMVVWGSLDGVNYYCMDTILVKIGEVLIYKGRDGK